MFFRGWKSVAAGSADSDSDLDRFPCLCQANRRSIPNLDKPDNRPVTYPNLTLSPPPCSPPDTYRVSRK